MMYVLEKTLVIEHVKFSEEIHVLVTTSSDVAWNCFVPKIVPLDRLSWHFDKNYVWIEGFVEVPSCLGEDVDLM
jgi:hypothetical protein